MSSSWLYLGGFVSTRAAFASPTAYIFMQARETVNLNCQDAEGFSLSVLTPDLPANSSDEAFSIQVDVDRYTHHARCFFDRAWKRMPFELVYPAATYEISPPGALAEMIGYAEQIGTGFSYLRVDLYEIAGKVKFGEATFYQGAGLEFFHPRKYDTLFGEQWN